MNFHIKMILIAAGIIVISFLGNIQQNASAQPGTIKPEPDERWNAPFIRERREWLWFFSLNFYDPHPQFDPPLEYLEKYTIEELPGSVPPDNHKEFVRCEFYDALMPRDGERPEFATMYRTRKYKLVNYHGAGKGELFDLEKDPDELHNLWDNTDYHQIRFELMKKSFDLTVRCMDTGPERLGRY